MNTQRLVGATLAALITVGVGTTAFAQNNSRQANLQAMRWYAQQQMARGMPNPYPGVNLNTGAGFRQFRRNAVNPYYANYRLGNPYANNPYGNNMNQWYGNNRLGNPSYGANPWGSSWF